MDKTPFTDIRALIAGLPPPPPASGGTGRNLGALEPVAAWIGDWRGRYEVNRPILALYAATHEGAGEADATRARLEAIAAGEDQAARAARHSGAGLDVFDLAVDRPAPDMTVSATLSERDCAATMAFGMEALAKQPDLLILGGFGTGSDAAAAALLLALLGEAAAPWAGERARTGAARAAAEAGGDPLALLRQLGGRETAALAGAILAARAQGTSVLLDGPAALAAAAVLARLAPAAVAHCRAAEPALAAAALGLAAVSEQALGLAVGAGGLAALGLARLAVTLAAPVRD